MLKKRLIFSLLFDNGNFFLSRNFKLQKIGNFEWLKKNYNFTLIAKSVDEINILDVSRDKQDIKNFCNTIRKFTKNCFIPLSVGGKVDSVDKAKYYLDSGADKLIINSELFNLKLIQNLSKNFGEQCLIGSLDYKYVNDEIFCFKKNGSKKLNMNLSKIFKLMESLPIGEVILNSIDRDGTGFGFDFKILNYFPKEFKKPLIFSGGAGNYKHLLEAFNNKQIDGIATANLLNFVGDGLQEARLLLSKNGVKLAEWL